MWIDRFDALRASRWLGRLPVADVTDRPFGQRLDSSASRYPWCSRGVNVVGLIRLLIPGVAAECG